MTKDIEPKLKKIGDYLKLSEENSFVIPAYQRAYSWGIGQCDKLWQDIIDFCENGRKDSYFFGTIIINSEGDTLELIDGQQRTTTFLLLLKALLIRINAAIVTTPNDEDSAKLRSNLRDRRKKIMGILYRVETDNISDYPDETDREIYCRPIVLRNESINEDGKFKQDLETIMKAATFEEAESAVYHIGRKQKDNKYTNFFRNFKFFYHKFDEEPMRNIGKINVFAKTLLDGCEVIEIRSWAMGQAISMFNSLNSDGLPLYDSDIISAKLYAAASALGKTDDYSKLWSELKAQTMALEELGISNLNALLMQYMYYIRTVNGETVTANGTVNVTTPGLRRYFTEDNKKPVGDPIGMCKDLLKLVKAWQAVANLEEVKVLLKFNENAKLFLASYLLRRSEEEISEDGVNEENVKKIAEGLLRLFAVLELVDLGYSSKPFKIFLFREEVKLADPAVSEEEIGKDFIEHINAAFKRYDLSKATLSYDGNALVYLNEYLFAREKRLAFSLDVKCDIEHIMPNSGNNLQMIRQDAGITDAKEFEAVVNKLGNKILLEAKINRSIGNEWFRTKISTRLSEKTGYVDSVYPIASYLVKKYAGETRPLWTKDDIETATGRAGNRIVGFVFGTDETIAPSEA